MEAAPADELTELPAAEEKSEAEILEELGLPDPDTMKAGDDFSAFMKEAVPDRIRRRALRVLWGSNPVLANLDELVDYGEDFTDAATVVANLQTAWKVGKGFRDKVIIPPKAEPEADPETASDDGQAEGGADQISEADHALDEDAALETAVAEEGQGAPLPSETAPRPSEPAASAVSAEEPASVATARRRIRFSTSG